MMRLWIFELHCLVLVYFDGFSGTAQVLTSTYTCPEPSRQTIATVNPQQRLSQMDFQALLYRGGGPPLQL